MIPIQRANAFSAGQTYPPQTEMIRIALFEKYFRWSNRNYAGLDPNVSSGATQTQFAQPAQALRLQPNMLRFLMTFWSDAVSERPVIEYADNNPRVSDFISRLASQLAKTSELVVADMIRYGCGIFYSRHALRPESLDPRYWFPIAEGYENDQVSYGDIVAVPFSSGENAHVMTNDRILIAEHTASPMARIAELDGLTIGKTTIQLSQYIFTPNAIVVCTLGEGRYGVSDFADAAEYVAELHRLESQLSLSLQKHSNPHFLCPQGSLIPGDDGSVRLNAEGSVIFQPDGERVPAQYISWDPKFDQHSAAIERAEQRILRLSQIAPILATPGAIANGLSIPSGSALRRLALISVNRLRVIRNELTEAYKRVIPAQAQLLADLGGERIAIDGDKITVAWPPPFGTGYQDEADAIAALVGSKAMSQPLARALVEQISRQEAEEEIAKEGDADASRVQDLSA